MMKDLLTIIIVLLMFSCINNGIPVPLSNTSDDTTFVDIIDPQFKYLLVSNTSINTNRDTEISIKEAKDYTKIIDVSNKNIKDLQGIEAFVNLTILNCDDNRLTKLDLSENNHLINLNCSNNRLANLDIRKNTTLKYLHCDDNDLTKLDLSKNDRLINLNCSNNRLTNLDVSRNSTLRYLYCDDNNLRRLDVTKNNYLEIFSCIDTQLEDLDVSNNLNLIDLNVTDNSDLICIKINSTQNITNWSKDRTASYSTNICP